MPLPFLITNKLVLVSSGSYVYVCSGRLEWVWSRNQTAWILILWEGPGGAHLCISAFLSAGEGGIAIWEVCDQTVQG